MISEVVVSRSVRVNLGDYQHVDFFVSMKALVGEDDDASATTKELRCRVEGALVGDIRLHFKSRGQSISRAQISKRYGLHDVRS